MEFLERAMVRYCSLVVCGSCGIIFKVLSLHAGQSLLENFQTTKIFAQSL